jgi:N6-adenosine-specific RNA methylase IME4
VVFFFDGLKMSDTPRGAADNYQLMNNDDIKKMPVSSIADPDGAILALWVPSSLLQEGLDVMKAWGFSHKQTYIWVKNKKSPYDTFKKYLTKNFIKNLPTVFDKSSYKDIIKSIQSSLKDLDMNDCLAFGMGRLFRQCHEICLVGINNNKIYKHLSNKSQRSVSFSENLKHSIKPENLQNSLELMFPGDINRIELFARRQRRGWYCFGNESPMTKGEDIYKSLQKVISVSEDQFCNIKSVLSNYQTTDNQRLYEEWNKI